MELKATAIGKHLAQHPYNRVRMLNAGVEVSGERHQYLIPFNQLLAIHCKRGLVWGELEFELPQHQVVRLHGTEWNATQRFFHHLNQCWQRWSAEMSEIAASVLRQQLEAVALIAGNQHWLRREDLAVIQGGIREACQALPFPAARLDEFEHCRTLWRRCQAWLKEGETYREQQNDAWTHQMLQEHRDFFETIESAPLNVSQARAVVNGESSLLVLAGAGSGKTSVLVARAGWLLLRQEALPEQILLLAFGRNAAREIDERIAQRLHAEAITARTFHSLALYILQQSGGKIPRISQLETGSAARQHLLIEAWQQQCQNKKTQAVGWRQWLSDELGWALPEGEFWKDEKLACRLAPRLERWLGLMRMHGGSQAVMIADCPEEIGATFQKRIRLMAPLLKAWKSALKEEGAVDFSGLIHQAINALNKGRFISPWKHILVDEFQDISPQRAALLEALRRQNTQTTLFAVGDDWQAIYRFSGAELSLTTAFEQTFGGGDYVALDTTYRFNRRIGEIASRFIQQNPGQLEKPLNSLTLGDKNAVALLGEDKFEALLDKLSGYVENGQRVLILARYHYLRPAVLDKAATRWPKLCLDFLTIHASKGQQADYVIILGLQNEPDAFPAKTRESVIEQALLPPQEDFPDAEERRLLYVALTRAKHRVWLLYHSQRPSIFVDTLKQLGVPVLRKP
ncbi:DNA helicase IV [Erwinia sp. HR93]|uniref:DNA helicase IV n=1 Tax=Erwinia sp. HR93 TaxID=3094840 RepID=UPI002ADEE347|nr:DNA helicase IV [Erwinia sp. HR93]MEA1064691.1 DNA helicase IV [Erwinia sp. HR93]